MIHLSACHISRHAMDETMGQTLVLALGIAVFACAWCCIIWCARRSPRPVVVAPVLAGEVTTAAAPDCVICLDEIFPGDHVCTLACAHTYHTNCIRKWAAVSSECPLCKTPI